MFDISKLPYQYQQESRIEFPKVSVIMPNFNGYLFLKESINSVLEQSLENIELIIIDDCSFDDSRSEIIRLVKGNPKVGIVFNEVNFGSGNSRNIGIYLAKGEWIAFLDADDIWLKDKLSKQIEFAKQTNSVMLFSSYGKIDESGVVLKNRIYLRSTKISYQSLLRENQIGCLTAMYHSGMIGKYYMSSHRNKQDYFLWLSILKKGHEALGIIDVTALYRVHKNSATNKKHRLLFSHIVFLRETQNLSLLKSCYYTLTWLFYNLQKHLLSR